MYLLFEVDGPEALDALRHFAGCRTHQAMTLDALVESTRHFLAKYDRGEVDLTADPARIGIQIQGEQEDGSPPEPDGGDAWIPLGETGDGTPTPPPWLAAIISGVAQAIDDAMKDDIANAKRKGPQGPPPNPRMN